MELKVSGFIPFFARTYLYNRSIDAGLQSRKSRAPVHHRLAAFPQVVAAGCRTTQGALKRKNFPPPKKTKMCNISPPKRKIKKKGRFPSSSPRRHPEEAAHVVTSGLGVNGSHCHGVGEAQLVGRGAGEHDAHEVGGFGSARLLQLLLAQILLRDDACETREILTSTQAPARQGEKPRNTVTLITNDLFGFGYIVYSPALRRKGRLNQG